MILSLLQLTVPSKQMFVTDQRKAVHTDVIVNGRKSIQVSKHFYKQKSGQMHLGLIRSDTTKSFGRLPALHNQRLKFL